MLLIWEVTSGADAKNYYANSVAVAKPSRQEYYSEGQEAPGRYGGRMADDLGIAGQVVDKTSFDRLCDNLHPTRPGRLTPRTNDKRRVCYDFTVSGPKSFSVIEAMAPDERERRLLRRLFDESWQETIAEDIEPDMQARERRAGADHDITTGNVLTVGFPHLTSRPVDNRPPDPHFHNHTLFWNATKTADGRTVAGQFGNIVRDKAYYEAAFYSRLARKLESAGYAIDRRGGKEWEIAGVPQSLIDKFSKRTEEIDAEAERREIRDAARKGRLGAELRSKKQKDLTMPELRKAWNEQMTDGERDALAAVYRRDVARGPQVTASQAVEFAIAHLAEQQSAWPERELKRVALLHSLGCCTPEQIAAELPRHGVIVREIAGRRMATVDALQREEDHIIGFAAGGRGDVRPVGVPEGLTRTLADGKRLSDEQFDIVRGLLSSSNRVNLVQGPAGAGKSWSLQKYDEAMRRAGEKVTFLATTTDAVEVLKADGFKDTQTLAHFLLDGKIQKAARGGRVVIDEIGMCGHRDFYRLCTLAAQLDLKLVLVGDPLQHGSVARGAVMRVLTEYGGITPFRLTQIMRQEDADYLAAARLLSEGKSAEGFDALNAKGWVKEIAGDAERDAAIAAEYVQALKDNKSVILVSPTHAEGRRVTQALRAQLRELGKLGREEREFIRLVPANASEAERGVATTYRPGDVLCFHQNAKGFKKGDRLTVTDPAGVPLAEASKFSLYRPETLGLSVGDKIRGTGTVSTVDGRHKLRNGSLHSVAGFTAGGDIKLDNGWVLPADAGMIRMGWVDTSFSSQGRTVQRAILAMSAASLPATNREQMYVSSTRAKQKLTLFTDDKAAVRAGIQQSSQKVTASDLRADRPAATPWERSRKRLARRRRLEVIARTRAAYPTPVRQPERHLGHER